MSTAREQAREAASFVNLGDVLEVDVRLLADAASDVWEPLLFQMVKAFEPLGHTTGFNAIEWKAIKAAKEALGIDD